MADEPETIVHRVQKAWSSGDPIDRTWAVLFKLAWEGGLAAVFTTAVVALVAIGASLVQEISIQAQAGLVGIWGALFVVTFRMLFCNVILSLEWTDNEEPQDEDQTRLDAIEAQDA